MQQSFKYKAFISYSHADRKWARWLHRNLESYRAPRRLIGKETSTGPVPSRLTPVFRDREELASSPDLSARIGEALEQSENLVVICSPDAAKSRWVNQEVEVFKALGRADRVFALIVKGEPGTAGTSDDCFPPAMRHHYDADGNILPGIAEPIAADARKTADGRSGAHLKLVAGLIGVGLDDLRQREAQRKNRRMALITMSSVVAVVVTAFLAIEAMLARDEADRRREQAEDLLGFMVGDLRERLEPIGRLDLLEEVGDQAMSYFATVRLDELTDTELRRQAQVITQLGEIRISELQYTEALTSFTEAYERSAALYRNDPSDGERLFDRSQSEFWVAFVHWRSADLDQAREWLTRYRDSSIELAQLDPERDDWVQEVAFGHHNLAVLDHEIGNLYAAAAGFSRELDTLYELQARDETLARRYDIADAISWLGNIALSQGELTSALEFYVQSAEHSEYLTLADPENRQWQYNQAHALQRIVDVTSIIGELDRAAILANGVILAFDALANHDPDNLDWQRASTKPLILKGEILAADGDLSEARALAQQAIARLEDLVDRDASDYHVLDHLADAYALLSWVEKDAGNHATALDASRLAIDTLGSIADADRLNDERSGKLASAYIARGELQLAIGEPELAAESWQQAVELLQNRVNQSNSHFLLDPWARALARVGRELEANRVRGALEARRYVPLKAWAN